MCVFGFFGASVVVLALIPCLSKFVLPIIDWVKMSLLFQTEGNDSIIEIIITISLPALAGGFGLIKNSNKILDKQRDKIEKNN